LRQGAHKQPRNCSCFAIGASIIGIVDQVPVLPDDLIGLALSRFIKCIHELPAKGGEATNDMTDKGSQCRAGEAGTGSIGVDEYLRRHYSLQWRLCCHSETTRTFGSVGIARLSI
jgi:hypothetical protein